MTRLSFHGDPALKDRAMARLRDHVAAGDFRFAPPWEDGKGSALGCMIEGDDPAVYAAALGYPDPLAMVLDDLVSFRPMEKSPSAGTDFALAWLAATPVGVDLSPVAGKVVVTMLDHPLVVSAMRRSAPAAGVRAQVVGLHQAALADRPPSREAWRDARRQAVRVTDGASDDLIRNGAAIVEAAAWPHQLPTTLSDTLRALAAMSHRKALNDIGWNDTEEQAVFAAFAMIHDEATTADLPFGKDLLQELALRDPALAARFAEQCDALERSKSVYEEVGDAIVGLVGANVSRD